MSEHCACHAIQPAYPWTMGHGVHRIRGTVEFYEVEGISVWCSTGVRRRMYVCTFLAHPLRTNLQNVARVAIQQDYGLEILRQKRILQFRAGIYASCLVSSLIVCSLALFLWRGPTDRVLVKWSPWSTTAAHTMPELKLS